MYRHTPSCLRGPLTRNRAWWRRPARDRAAPDAPRLGDGTAAAIRADLVARVRREIAEGSYDTPEKWDIALGRLLARLEYR
jgi:hypothetical protein